MMYLQWDQSLTLGVDVIDDQHHRLVDYINDLELSVRNEDQETAERLIGKILDDTIAHFAFEEALMERAGYEIWAEHQQRHRAFIRLIESYQKRVAAGEDVLPQLLPTLSTWLTNHIKRDDRDYVAVVHELEKRLL